MAQTQKPSQTRGVFESMGALEKAFIAPMGVYGTVMTEAWLRLCEEWSGFVTRRVQQDARIMSEMLHCQSPADLPKIQAAFWQKAMEEYQEEAGRMNAVLREASRRFSSAEARSKDQDGLQDGVQDGG